MPSRGDLEPAQIKSLLPNVILMDVMRDVRPGWPLDFRYRLIGTELETWTHGRYTGMHMSDLPHQRPPSKIWRSLLAVTEARRPQFNRVPYVGPHKDFMSVVDVVMPLSNDGETVDMLFCAIDFVPRERMY